MDVIKTESEVDPLAVQSYDDAVTEEADSSQDQAARMESSDPIYDRKWMKGEEPTLSIEFPVADFGSKEEKFGVDTVKDEDKVEIMREDEELTKRWLQLFKCHHDIRELNIEYEKLSGDMV
ncbi:uncharacterized protein [Periplaneta americana]|uniref:uncharacterized protein isoform X7 n=1 Tax=Periplaneta americana TaxID=6978 RepID=UPI0037E93078